MKRQTSNHINALVLSIEEIGRPSKEFEYKSKKIIENLKKTRMELIEEAFDEAFNPNKESK